jgi:hypothetical protein
MSLDLGEVTYLTGEMYCQRCAGVESGDSGFREIGVQGKGPFDGGVR